MEIASQVLFVSSVFLCAVVVGVVSWMGSKEKTYEEALEESKKKQPQGHSKKTGHPSSASSSSSTSNKGKDKAKKKAATLTQTSSSTTGTDGHSASAVDSAESSKKKSPVVDPMEEPLILSASSSAPSNAAPLPIKDEPSTKNGILNNQTNNHTNNHTNNNNTKKNKKSPSNKEKKKTSKSPESLVDASSLVSVRDILSIVERTAMDEGECQHIIDVLLNKQVGESGASSSSWVSNSGSSSVKNLEKQLGETESELKESQARVKSLSDKLVQLRQELNAATILSNNSSRLMEEMRLKQEKDRAALLESHTRVLEARSRETSTLQSRLTAQLALTQELEAKVNQIAAPVGASPELTQEMEELKASKKALEAQLVPLSAELDTLKQGEAMLRQKLNEKEQSEVEILEAHEANVKKLEATIGELKEASAQSQLESQNRATGLQEEVKELTQVKEGVDRKVSALETSLEVATKRAQDSEDRAVKLAEEIKRLSESASKDKIDGDESLHYIIKEKEEQIKAQEVLVSNLKAEMESAMSQTQKATQDLEFQKEKNDDLRQKNWKAIEALKEAELKLINNQSQSKTQEDEAKIQARTQESLMEQQKHFLKRLLPEVGHLADSDYHSWVSAFEGEISRALADSNSSTSESTAAISKLEEQVSHYQSILSETENMLHSLQASVESEEGRWKSQLSEKEREITGLKIEKDRLSEKNSALDESINVVKQAEEMQVKLHELQEKLGSEEKEKKELLSRIDKLSSVETENAKLNEELSSLTSTNRSMGERIVKMDHIMSTGQDALQQEQRTVLVMRDQIQNLNKNTNEGGAHVENGLNGKATNGNEASEHNDNGDSLHGSQESINKKKNKKKKSKKDSQKV